MKIGYTYIKKNRKRKRNDKRTPQKRKNVKVMLVEVPLTLQ